MLHASGEESPIPKRRSRDMSGLSGLGVDIRGSPTTPTSRSPAMQSGFSTTVGSPPSPSSSISMAGSSVSRRSSINVSSPPRHLVSGSPTSHRLSRGSISGISSGLPLPFPAAPPPSESIKLQKVPESVRTAIEFRQGNPLAAAYAGEAASAPSGGPGFKSSTSPVEYRLPATPVATRAPSPASPTSSSRSSQHPSPSTSRPHSRIPSRQSSRERLSATSNSPLPTERSGASSAHSAFAPLFNVPAAPPAARNRERSRSVSVHSAASVTSPLSAHSTDPFPIPGPGPSSSRASRNSPPVFNLSSFSSGPQRAVSASVSPPTHRASASFASVGPSSTSEHAGPAPVFGSLGSGSGAVAALAPSTPRGFGGRLSSHRMSIAPAGGGGVAGFGAADSTDEYAQIILSTRNAKVRKWKTSGGAGGGNGPSVSTLEAGTAGTGKTWANLAEAGRSSSEYPPGEADIAGEGVAGYEVQPGTREIEWVDWLDEYRKMKEAKLKMDKQGEEAVEEEAEAQEADGAEKVEKAEAPQEVKPSTPSPPRRTELAEPALAAAQKGKAKATSASPPFLSLSFADPV